ncbi:hypothetical protein [Methanofollis aquaemaris]|nr:hypothetical protein [Methanofollis aquaemaris]
MKVRVIACCTLHLGNDGVGRAVVRTVFPAHTFEPMIVVSSLGGF